MLSKLFKRKPASPFRLVIEPLGRSVEVRFGESLLQAALAAGIPFPYSCKVGTCTSCKCRLLVGQKVRVWPQALGWEGEGFEPGEIKLTREWLRSRANSIEGGTSEIQLNIIAKRVLGLPD